MVKVPKNIQKGFTLVKGDDVLECKALKVGTDEIIKLASKTYLLETTRNGVKIFYGESQGIKGGLQMNRKEIEDFALRMQRLGYELQ